MVSQPPSPPQPTLCTMCSEDLAQEQHQPEPTFRFIIDTAEDMLIYRYGFALAGGEYVPAAGLGQPRAKGAKDFREVCSTLGRAAEPAWQGPRKEIVCDFVNHILGPAGIPANLCDLSQHHRARIRCQTRFMRIERRAAGEDSYYLIVPLGMEDVGGEPPWDLVVRDATTALECVRRFGGAGRIAIATHFARTGRPFSTRLHASNPLQLHVSTIPPVGLGWRQTGWKPSTHDFEGYWDTPVLDDDVTGTSRLDERRHRVEALPGVAGR